jgi:hypothetical protein
LARALEGLKDSSGGKAVRAQTGHRACPWRARLIEAHGGSSNCCLEPGQGTAAIVDLP